MANFVFNRGIAELFKGDTDLDVADLRVLLLKSSASPNRDHNVVADIVAGSAEISVSGYARQALTGETVTEDDTNDQVYLDANDPTFTALATGETVGWGALFRHTGNDATAPCLAAYDVADTPTNGTDMTLQFAAPASGGALRGV